MALKMQPKVVTAVPDVTPVVEPQIVPVVTPVTSDVEALTTEYIELYRKFDYFEMKAIIKRMDEIRKQLHEVANETVDGKKPAIFVSPQGEVEFSPRQNATTIPDPLALVQALLNKFGPEVTATVLDIALTPLRKLLSELELKHFITEVPGGRTVKSVRPVK